MHGLRFHDLRHTCAALAIERGAHPFQIKTLLGHEDIRTTLNIYGHLFPSMETALAASGQSIAKGDTVLINMGVNERLWGTPGYATDFPGLHVDSVHWLADAGVKIFGVEAVSPAPQGEPNFKAHLACGERGITHIECLWNLEAVVGKGRFTFIGFPLRIRGGTASPIRAVAMFERGIAPSSGATKTP